MDRWIEVCRPQPRPQKFLFKLESSNGVLLGMLLFFFFFPVGEVCPPSGEILGVLKTPRNPSFGLL